MGSQSVYVFVVYVCVYGRHLFQRFFFFFLLLFLCFCASPSFVVFGFCCVSAHLRSICYQTSYMFLSLISLIFTVWAGRCVCVCVRFAVASLIRIDLQQAFSSRIRRYVSYEHLKMEAQNMFGVRDKFLGNLLIPIWPTNSLVKWKPKCVCVCVSGVGK